MGCCCNASEKYLHWWRAMQWHKINSATLTSAHHWCWTTCWCKLLKVLIPSMPIWHWFAICIMQTSYIWHIQWQLTRHRDRHFTRLVSFYKNHVSHTDNCMWHFPELKILKTEEQEVLDKTYMQNVVFHQSD